MVDEDRIRSSFGSKIHINQMPLEKHIFFISPHEIPDINLTLVPATYPSNEHGSPWRKMRPSRAQWNVEYEVEIMGMFLVEEMGAYHIKLKTDSQLVVYQIRGETQAKDLIFQRYLKLATEKLEIANV